MSSEYKTMVKEAMLNNSFDEDVMDSSLLKTWSNSYSYLLNNQQAMVEYSEFHYFSNDTDSRDVHKIGTIYLDRLIRACFDIDFEMILNVVREKYRVSDYYGQVFTLEELVYKPDLFLKLPIVIIDDKPIWDYSVRVNKDSVTFILPFKRSFVLEDAYDIPGHHHRYINHKVQVMFVDNQFYQRLSVNKNTVGLSNNRTIKIRKSNLDTMSVNRITDWTNKYFLTKYNVTNISMLTPTQDRERRDMISRSVKQLDNLDNTGVCFCTIHYPSPNMSGYEFGTQMIPFVDTGDYYVGQLTESQYQQMKAFNRAFYMSFVFIQDLHCHTFYTGVDSTTAEEEGASIIVLEEEPFVPYKSPIPTCNFMIYTQEDESSEFILEKNVDVLTLHYPNIYEITDPNIHTGKTYRVFYFYHEIDDLKYTCLFDFYFRFLYERFNNLTVLFNDMEIRTIPTGEPTPEGVFLLGNIGEDVDGTIMLDGQNAFDDLFTFNRVPVGQKTVIMNGEKESEDLFIFKRDYLSTEKIINDCYYQTADFSKYTEAQKRAFYEVFQKIWDYRYTVHLYGEFDFLERYRRIIGNEDKTPFEYKVNTLKSWIKDEPWVLRDYVNDQKKLGSCYHLFTNTIDLPSRVRRDTSHELDGEVITFDEDMYVFKMNNDTNYPRMLDLRFYCDGLFVNDLKQYRQKFTDYIYIPTRLITNDSYLEIEIFPDYRFTKEFKFTSLDETMEITLPRVSKDIFPTTADVFYMKEDNGLYREYVDPKLFDIKIKTSRGDFVVISDDPEHKPVKFTRINTFTVKPNDINALNIPLEFSIKKYGSYMKLTVKKEGILMLKFVGAELDHNFHNDYIRVFDPEGRLIPKCNYRLHTYNGDPWMIIYQSFHVGDILTIDYTPYRYREVAYIENLPASPDAAIIDLRDYMNKPFDIRYFDVFVNGRKKSINSVFTISPWEIAIVNRKSNYNLSIMERERDWEFFGLDYKENIYYFTFDDLISSGAITDEEKDAVVQSIIRDAKDPRLTINPNTNYEPKYPWVDYGLVADDLIYYWGVMLPKRFHHPDYLQEGTNVLENDFPDIFEAFVDTHTGTMSIDPDKFVGYPSEDTMLVLPIGHLMEDVEQEILDQNPLDDFDDSHPLVPGDKGKEKIYIEIDDDDVVTQDDGSQVILLNHDNMKIIGISDLQDVYNMRVFVGDPDGNFVEIPDDCIAADEDEMVILLDRQNMAIPSDPAYEGQLFNLIPLRPGAVPDENEE